MPRLSLDDVLAKCSPGVRRLNAGLFPADGVAPAPVVERDLPIKLEKAAPAKTCDTRKRLVSVVSYRRRELDEDNLCEKFHVDALRYAGILPSDEPGRCHIVTTQKKVRHKKEERTEITVTLI